MIENYNKTISAIQVRYTLEVYIMAFYLYTLELVVWGDELIG